MVAVLSVVSAQMVQVLVVVTVRVALQLDKPLLTAANANRANAINRIFFISFLLSFFIFYPYFYRLIFLLLFPHPVDEFGIFRFACDEQTTF